VPGDRRLRILAELHGDEGGVESHRICGVSASVTGMTGAGIMLMSGDVPRGSVCSSDPASALIEDLQFTLGEGPCVDAYRHDRAVLEPDLAGGGPGRWPAFTSPAVEVGARAVFGFPLRVGAIRIGALNLYRDRPGPLDDDQHADALVLAGVAARSVLVMQAGGRPWTLGVELESGSDFRFVVHQASGMVSVQLQVGVGEALVRLRAYSFADDRPLTEVAADVVARRLRFS
jgi:GAF domain-containing protein